MVKSLLLIFFLFTALPLFAQKTLVISGTIKDEATGETLIGASVRIKELPQSGTATNSYGFYSLSAPKGDYTLLYTYIGYKTIIKQVSLNQSQTINAAMSANSELAEVVIRSDKPNNDNVASPQMGLDNLSMSQINRYY